MGLFLQLLVRGLITGSLYALLGVSWGLIYNTTRTFHFAHGFVYAITAYVIVLAMNLTLPLGLSIVIGLAAATAVGCLLEYFIYLPMRRKFAAQLPIFLTSLGVMFAGQSALHLVFGPDSRPLQAFAEEIFILGPIVFTNKDLVALIGASVLIGLLFLFLRMTKAGMMIRAVSSNPEKAIFIGIDSRKIFILVFGIGSMLVGAAAFLATLDTPATPHIGLNAILMSFIVVFLGGVGSLPGAAIGGFLLGIVESLVILVLPTEYKIVVTFLILFIVILFKPEGLMGEKSS